MKKYAATTLVSSLILFVVFAAIPVSAQTSPSLWQKMISFSKQVAGIEQTAAVVTGVSDGEGSSSSNDSSGASAGATTQSRATSPSSSASPSSGATTDVESEPAPLTGGCGRTLTPLGLKNQTIRCDGTNWVAAKNLLNDATNVSIGADLPDAHTLTKFLVSSNYARPTITGMNMNSGEGVQGYSSSGTGVSGITAGVGDNAVGVKGDGPIGVYGIGDVRGGGGIAVKAQTDSGFGFYQVGQNSRNYFEGGLIVGGDSSNNGSAKVDVLGVDTTSGGFGGDAIHGRAGSGFSGVGVRGETAPNQNFGVGVKGVSSGGFSTAVVAEALNGSTGFSQIGGNARNLFDGTIKVGASDDLSIPTGVKVKIEGGLQIMTVVASSTISIPTCQAGTRGTFWFTQGNTGVADSALVCARNASSTYAWRNLF